jgi:multiple sugar transport system permease protein
MKMISIKQSLMYAALVIAGLTFIYPFLWMIGASFAPMQEIGNMTLWPSHPTWGNFRSMFGKIPIGRSLINS